MTVTPSPQSVVVPDPLWMMHVIGPDDIYPAPDHATAVQWCAYLNSEIAPKVPSVLCVAVPAIWTGTAEEHAEGLAEAIKGWTVPAAPAPSSLAGGEMLKALLDHIDSQTCTHENTKHGGAIWTICEDCGRKWADDEGGFKPHVDAPAVAAAREYLAALSPEAPALEGGAHSVAVGRLTWAANTHPDPEKRALLTGWAEECQAVLTPRHEAPALEGGAS